MRLSPVKLTVANGFDKATLRELICSACGYPLDPGETAFGITLKGEDWDSEIYCSRFCGTPDLETQREELIHNPIYQD